MYSLLILQAFLKEKGLYAKTVDGKDGPGTQAAIAAFLSANGINDIKIMNSSARKLIAAEQLFYKLKGLTEVGAIDGYAGPSLAHVREQYVELETTGKIEPWRDNLPVLAPAAAPVGNKTARFRQASLKWPLQKDCPTFYGAIGSGQVQIEVPYPLKLAWAKTTIMKKITVHGKIADAVSAALQKVSEIYTPAQIKLHGFDLFGGCFNNRPMRGGSNPSMHAYSCALDFDPERNPLKNVPGVTPHFALPECEGWIDAWEEQGAISLGRQRNMDWMHVQFARLS